MTCISSHGAPRRLPPHPRGRWGSSPSSPNCLLALRTLSCACPFLGQAKASLVWEVGIRKVGAGPPLDPVTSVVGPVWMPAEACHTQNSFVLLTFQQSPLFSQTIGMLTEPSYQGSPCLSTHLLEERTGGRERLSQHPKRRLCLPR